MKMYVLFVLTLLFCLFILSPSAIARSGCCSHHGGVCGCGCCDGSSLSSTCAPYYPWCNSPPPTPTPVIIPTNLNGSSSFNYDDSTKSYDVFFNWDDWSQSTGWSIGISQYAGADPGPNMDTTSSIWTFRNVSPGRKYINMKASVNGYWSTVSYWTIDVPPFPTATPTPTYTPTPTITPTPKPTEVIKKKINNIKKITQKKSFWQWLFGN
jgi:hypothetical protein